MPTVAIIFNGLHFSQAIAEKALAYATQSNSDLLALFLKTKSEKSPDYGYPSDLGAAETISTDEDANADDKKIIESNIRLLQHEASMNKISLRYKLLEGPSREELMQMLSGCNIVFCPGHDEHGKEVTAAVDLKPLMDGITVPIEIVP